MDARNKYRAILKQYWGFDSFRPLQEDIIESVATHGADTLGLLPTGGGKSILFQVPALAAEGLCLVITPLISLMKDQVENLKKRQIKAAAIFSGMTRNEIEVLLNNCQYGAYKFLYISPERISTSLFLEKLPYLNVTFIAIDEAHCISQWGYDFRPSYLKIAELRQYLPNVPVLALTATATPEVVKDIQNRLSFRKENVFRKSFSRKNLTYLVRYTEDKLNYLLRIVNNTKGSGVVYVRLRKKTAEVAEFLNQNRVSADFYHAGIKAEDKDRKQKEWKEGRTRIIVATNAFGMGIDKPDVRFVVHLDLPDSPEAYFQEAGRAGRDEKTAFAVLLFAESDRRKAIARLENGFPPIADIKGIYNALGNYFQLPIGAGAEQSFDFDMYDFAERYKMPLSLVHASVSQLQNDGYLALNDDFYMPSVIRFIVDREELYKIQVANPQVDMFIKLILRMYTGLFTEYVPIDERYIARTAKSEPRLIYEYLKSLSKLNIIQYIPRRATPRLTYITERLENANLRINTKDYRERKERSSKRLAAMLTYAMSRHKCRSRLLLEYFGENDAENCGICDVCRNDAKIIPDTETILKYEQLILQEVALHDVSIDDLVETHKLDIEILSRVVMQMLEDKKIIYNVNLLLSMQKN